MNTEISLGTGESDRQTELGDRAGQQYRSELIRRMGTDVENEASRSAGSLRNLDTAFERTTDWRNSANQANLLQRAMEQQDWQAAADLLREANGEELTAIDVRNLAYSRGQDWITQNLGRRDAGMANLAQLYAREGTQAGNAAATAGNFGDAASRSYDATRQQEAGRGNWGTRLITGAATAGLDLLVPGLGTSVGRVAGGVNGGAPGGTGGFAGPYGQGGSTAYGFNWQGTQAPQTQQNPWSQIYQYGRQVAGGGGGGNFNVFDPRTGGAIIGGV